MRNSVSIDSSHCFSVGLNLNVVWPQIKDIAGRGVATPDIYIDR